MNSPSHSIRYAWLIVALLVPVALLNYLDRQMLATMKFSVMGDITDIGSEANWGRMLGQFKWVYAFLSPIGGYLADRYSRRLTICGSLFAWSAVNTGRGVEEDIVQSIFEKTWMDWPDGGDGFVLRVEHGLGGPLSAGHRVIDTVPPARRNEPMIVQRWSPVVCFPL